MKQLSIWAKNSPIQARWLIAAIQTFQIISGIYIGLWLFIQETYIHYGWTIAALLILSSIIWFYPSGKIKASNYHNRKRMNMALSLSIYFLIITCSNHLIGFIHTDPVPKQQSALVETQAQFVVMKYKDKDATPHSSEHETINQKPQKKKKGWRKMLGEKIKEYKSKGRVSWKGWLKILFVLAIGIGLAVLLAMLTCHLACYGYTIAATVVASLGSTLILLGLIFVIRRIVRNERRKKRSAERKRKRMKNKGIT